MLDRPRVAWYVRLCPGKPLVRVVSLPGQPGQLVGCRWCRWTEVAPAPWSGGRRPLLSSWMPLCMAWKERLSRALITAATLGAPAAWPPAPWPPPGLATLTDLADPPRRGEPSTATAGAPHRTARRTLLSRVFEPASDTAWSESRSRAPSPDPVAIRGRESSVKQKSACVCFFADRTTRHCDRGVRQQRLARPICWQLAPTAR